MKDTNYIAIADWMVTDLGLNTRELLCYAIIYGFSQDGESVFSGSLSYLGSWLNIRRDNVLRYLNSLEEKGLIIKEKKNSASKVWCEYRVNLDRGEVRNSDHIIISPWMIAELGLQDKELILYALIYGFSRVGSNSFFTGNNAYMGKWLLVNKANVNRYTSSLIKKGLIERVEDNKTIKYKANVVNIKGKEPNQNEYTIINKEGGNQNEYTPNQGEYTSNHFEEKAIIKLSTNNINIKSNINTNRYFVDSEKRSSRFNEERFEELSTPVRERYLEALKGSEDCVKMLSDAKNLILEVINNYSLENIQLINSLNAKECCSILEEAISLVDELDLAYHNIHNPKAKLSSKIKKYISIQR